MYEKNNFVLLVRIFMCLYEYFEYTLKYVDLIKLRYLQVLFDKNEHLINVNEVGYLPRSRIITSETARLKR